MKMSPSEPRSLWTALNEGAAGGVPRGGDRFLWGAQASLRLADLAAGTCLERPVEDLHRRCVLLLTQDPLAAAAALIELDGIAKRLVLGPPDLSLDHLPHVVSIAEIDVIVTDREDINSDIADGIAPLTCRVALSTMRRAGPRPPGGATEWILFTSGTTGVPKMVLHDLASLAGAIRRGVDLAQPAIWATYYDIRRFGGLQIFLRAVLGGGSLVLTSPEEAIPDFLERARSHGATHVTGTPSHWRRVLMSPAAQRIAPHYVRLSGEIADQGILDALRNRYPHARVAHAFATTEAGLAFEVNDGLAGFPASLCGSATGEVEMTVAGGTLRIRSPRTARRYLGAQAEPLIDSSGFIDTGDLVELRGDRYYFAGRRGGIINVGGLKVHPEEVEAVINRHPSVSMSLVRSRRNPITGALVVADVVLADGVRGATGSDEAIKEEILADCRRTLAAHKVPAVIRFVPSLPLTPAGKVARADA